MSKSSSQFSEIDCHSRETKTVRVIVSHPARQGNIYYRARAAEEMGADVTFLTGLYYRPDRLPYSLLQFLPEKKKNDIEVLLEKRRIEGLNPENVVSLLGPLLELTLRPMGKYREWWSIHDWLASQWVRHNVRKTDVTVLHVFDGACQHTLRAAGRLEKSVRLMELTLPPVPGSPETATAAALRQELNEADFVLAQSEFSAQYMMSAGVDPKRVIRCHLGVDTKYFRPRQGLRRSGPVRFLFLGGASQRKGLAQLLRAWQLGKAAGELGNAELILAGNRTADLGDMLAKVPDCRSLGRVPDENFVAFVQDADVLVHPSWAEGGCNVVYEALACGLPCVVSTNATSAVRNEVDGIVFPVGNVEALKESMIRVNGEPEVRSRMALSARQRAVSLRWEKYLAKVGVIYQGLAQHALDRSFETVQGWNALNFD